MNRKTRAGARRLYRLAGICGLWMLYAGLAPGAMIAQWTFNEGSGTVAFDSTTNANHGTIEGGALYVPTTDGFALSLDGVDDFVNYGSSPLFNFTTQPFTVEAWVAVDTDSQTSNQHGILHKASFRLGFWHGSDNTYQGFLNGNLELESATGAATPSYAWRHVAMTRVHSGMLKLYVDGVQVAGKFSFSPLNDSSGVDLISGECCGGNNLTGLLDEIRVYDTELSAPEIARSFAAGPAGLPTVSVSEQVIQDAASICVSSIVDAAYTLQYADDIMGPFTDAGPTVEGTGGNLYLVDSTPAVSTTGTYYRIRQNFP